MNIEIALENNFKVTKEPLIKMALDRIEELKSELDSKSSIIADLDESEGNFVSQLEKAKEIIQHFVYECKMCRAYPEKYKMWYQEIEKAEAFLKEN